MFLRLCRHSINHLGAVYKGRPPLGGRRFEIVDENKHGEGGFQANFLCEIHPSTCKENAGQVSFGVLKSGFGILKSRFGILKRSLAIFKSNF